MDFLTSIGSIAFSGEEKTSPEIAGFFCYCDDCSDPSAFTGEHIEIAGSLVSCL